MKCTVYICCGSSASLFPPKVEEHVCGAQTCKLTQVILASIKHLLLGWRYYSYLHMVATSSSRNMSFGQTIVECIVQCCSTVLNSSTHTSLLQ